MSFPRNPIYTATGTESRSQPASPASVTQLFESSVVGDVRQHPGRHCHIKANLSAADTDLSRLAIVSQHLSVILHVLRNKLLSLVE